MDFGRVVTAMATPFTADHQLDEAGLRVLVDHLIETGTTALAVCGTTGESPTLTHEEKLQVIRLTVEAARGRVPVIAGTGNYSTAESVALSKEAEALGADGLLLVVPYYNRPTQDGLYRHFRAIAEAVSLPVMLYNIPSRSAVNLSVETILKLAEIPNVVALKEATADFGHILQIAARKPDDLLLYSGNDNYTLPMLSVGACGVVSVASHVAGREIAHMIDAYVRGDVQEASMWHSRLLPLFDSLFRVTSPAPLKAALRLLGLPGGPVRLPLVEAPDDVVAEVKKELIRLQKL
ncbi:MAG: 4-hydroxy-tetrahydrodipicolinate synthase [Alicyclobacillaceae bacterium]|nr:4-hydroxy-tetrahydrodipicolinate synthase [Alicyclobacillaceae bacterium]